MSNISIIIPTLNEEKCIASLLEQLITMPHQEIIVCDGGSTDDTLKICSEYPVKVVQTQRGRGRQLNYGASVARGEILFFLHADSQVERQTLDDIVRAVQNNRCWGCCTLSFDKKNCFYHMVAVMSNLRSRLTSSCYGDQGIFCRRDIFQAYGGFPDWTIMEDVEFSRKMRRLSRAFVVPGRIVTSCRRFEDNGPWRTILKMQLAKLGFMFGIHPERIANWYQAKSKGR